MPSKLKNTGNGLIWASCPLVGDRCWPFIGEFHQPFRVLCNGGEGGLRHHFYQAPVSCFVWKGCDKRGGYPFNSQHRLRPCTELLAASQQRSANRIVDRFTAALSVHGRVSEILHIKYSPYNYKSLNNYSLKNLLKSLAPFLIKTPLNNTVKAGH